MATPARFRPTIQRDLRVQCCLRGRRRGVEASLTRRGHIRWILWSMDDVADLDAAHERYRPCMIRDRHADRLSFEYQRSVLEPRRGWRLRKGLLVAAIK